MVESYGAQPGAPGDFLSLIDVGSASLPIYFSFSLFSSGHGCFKGIDSPGSVALHAQRNFVNQKTHWQTT